MDSDQPSPSEQFTELSTLKFQPFQKELILTLCAQGAVRKAIIWNEYQKVEFK